MRLDFVYQEWPYAKVFRISREVRVASSLFVAYLRDGDHIGRGECGVLTQYGRTQMDIAAGFRQVQDITDDLSRDTLRDRIPLSEVRNAIDCALWDLECKKAGDTIWRRAGVEKTDAIEVDITIGIDTEEVMMQDAERAVGLGYKLLKIKSAFALFDWRRRASNSSSMQMKPGRLICCARLIRSFTTLASPLSSSRCPMAQTKRLKAIKGLSPFVRMKVVAILMTCRFWNNAMTRSISSSTKSAA